MYSSIILGLFTAAAYAAPQTTTSTSDSLPACPPRPVSAQEQADNFNNSLNELQVQKNVTEAFTNYVWEDYIQHNPSIGQVRDAAITALSRTVPNTNITVLHQTFSGTFGYMHHYNIATGVQIKIMDVYRMNGSCIVEHWDVIANLTSTELGELSNEICTGAAGNCYTLKPII